MAAVHPGTSWLIDAKPLATKLYQCQYHGSIFLYFEFSLYSLFFAIYQTTETLLLVAFIPQEYTHPRPTPLLSNHSTMALTKTLKPTTSASIIKTRSQSRTGTNVRTTDPVPPDPVVTTTNPVAVAVAVTAGGRTTGTTTLKDPPVPVLTGTKQAPRDRGSHDSDDNAKKPAAKPKKPKKVAPKATRKPRTSLAALDANELVDPMANIHVGNAIGVVTAGGPPTACGYAKATGNDPVLANPEHLDPEQPEDEPQPKKKTRRAVDRSRASRAPTMMRTPTAP